MTTQVQRIRDMIADPTQLYLRGRQNAHAAAEAFLEDHASRLALLTLLDEVEDQDATASLEAAEASMAWNRGETGDG